MDSVDQEAAAFWRRCERRPNGCLEWQGTINGRGYGVLQVRGRQLRAHRRAWELSYGAIPEGLFVCHKCDNPPCCDLDHLWLGTHQENMADRNAKGRQARHFGARNPMRLHPELVRRGAKNPRAKLSEEQILAIRSVFAEPNPPTYKLAGKAFGVGHQTIWRVVHGHRYAVVAPK